MKLLIIEDEHKIATSLKTGLEQENYTVDIAFDGTTGFDLASTGDYDLIILDLLLPGMDGLTICKQLRSAGVHTPIIMLTAKGDIGDRVTGLDSGADDYLSKPFAFVELLARIHAVTRRPKTKPTFLLTYADLQLDPQAFLATRTQTPLRLSKTEFTLLEYLLRHTDTILTKDQIIAAVWHYDSDILDNTVEVYIGYLRKKIDRQFPALTPLIHTVRGFGYKLSTSK